RSTFLWPARLRIYDAQAVVALADTSLADSATMPAEIRFPRSLVPRRTTHFRPDNAASKLHPTDRQACPAYRAAGICHGMSEATKLQHLVHRLLGLARASGDVPATTADAEAAAETLLAAGPASDEAALDRL